MIAAQRFVNAGTDRSQPGKPKLYRFSVIPAGGLCKKSL